MHTETPSRIITVSSALIVDKTNPRMCHAESRCIRGERGIMRNIVLRAIVRQRDEDSLRPVDQGEDILSLLINRD